MRQGLVAGLRRLVRDSSTERLADTEFDTCRKDQSHSVATDGYDDVEDSMQVVYT